MRRVLCAAVAVLSLLAAPSAAYALRPVVVGIGEQNPGIFSSGPWYQLGARKVRYIVGWDALHVPWQRAEVDTYMSAARAAGADVLLGFGHARSSSKARRKTLPTVRRYRREFLHFRKRYPFIRTYLTWNEANHPSQPTWNHPKRVGRFYDVLRHDCRRCTIVGPGVLDTATLRPWVKAVVRSARHRIGIWALNNYIDANRFRSTGTRALLSVTKARIWFTETGGLVRRDNGSRIEFAESRKHAAKAARWVFKLARISPRIRRIYFYHWIAPRRTATWDSALIDRRGRPRPAYNVVRTYVDRIRAAARRRRAAAAR